MAKAMVNTRVTKSLFDAAKLLLENGALNVEVAKYLKISKDVVGFIKKAETYEEYQTIMYEYSLKQRTRVAKRAIEAKKQEELKAEPPKVVEPQAETKQIVEYRQNVTVQATHYMQKELEKTNELLTIISNKLAFIVSDLYGVKIDAESDH